ncbi:hypothetical protein [Terribacillus saccharophilus]|uniref:DUF3953 domain-containing protein n=1 Tax=Terribacillus saccharophilus TaxID=361277 RepID=A0A268AAV8_9BACI|nr:hypothetical protein [Terribacillus saccharophilus]PAD21256.1 hypothetical protein CHH64_10015 [Terribacillus saccharophilus]PAF17045.1 hypothetical protein CHH51_14235 [Terribacillus saccharophilus]PAF21110.1 hypothetical protein CHH49_13800 [Terribacillus saccharophilus]PAF36055.1 hypothetical protein CHH58_13965 [Terribacillus saccharophilus]PAF39789.1 hypothetical protein CHH69_06360 [Terribacillus saccharophilus]
MLRKINALLAIIVIALGLYRYIDRDYEVNPQLMLPLLSIMFLLFSVESILNKKKLMTGVYLIVFVIAASATVMIFTQT